MEFAYNASALGVGGVIEYGSPQNRISTSIPSLASVALAPTGGEGKTVMSNYFSEELSFCHAETRVTGRETSKDIFTTFTYVYIKNLRILDTLTIAEMRATVQSTRALCGPVDHPFELDAAYRGVEVNGVEVAPEIDFTLSACQSYADVDRLIQSTSDDNDDNLLTRFGAITPEKKALLSTRVASGQAVQGSVVKRVHNCDSVGPSNAHKLYIAGFGTVVFGELMLKPGRRRLNMLRIAFGKNEPGQMEQEMREAAQAESRLLQSMTMNLEALPANGIGGTMTVASVEGNGSTLVP
ncbi:MAG TPA: hypothetical protein VF883_12805 [Thermoanaerobaculia bacterium]|jgi:hypothetical protein